MQIGARSCRAWRSAAQNFVGSQGLKRQEGNGTSPAITNHHHSCVKHSLFISSPLSWNLSCMCNLSTPVNTLLSLPLTQTWCWTLELSPKSAHHQSSVSGKRISDPQLCSSTLSHKLKFTTKLIWGKQLMQTQAHTTSLQYIHKTSTLSLSEDHCIILKSASYLKTEEIYHYIHHSC